MSYKLANPSSRLRKLSVGVTRADSAAQDPPASPSAGHKRSQFHQRSKSVNTHCTLALTPRASRSPSPCRARLKLGQTTSEERRRSVSINVPLGTTLGLSESQCDSIKSSWAKLYNPTHPHAAVLIMEKVHDAIKIRDPAVTKMFLSSQFVHGFAQDEKKVINVREHAKLILAFMDTVVQSLETDELPVLQQIAQIRDQHISALKNLGFRASFWEHFGEALVQLIVVQSAVKSCPGATKAWMILISSILDKFQQR